MRSVAGLIAVLIAVLLVVLAPTTSAVSTLVFEPDGSFTITQL